MSHPMASCWAKIERANENIHNLRDEQSEFIRSYLSSYGLRREYDPEAQELVVKAVGDDIEINPRFSVLIGEIVHNLRSSLDHVVYALATQGKPPTVHDEPWTKEISFPVLIKTPKKGKKFEAACHAKIKCVPGRAVATLESLQPYRDGRAAEDHPLAILQDFSNTDKHRLLLVIGAVLASADEITFSPSEASTTFSFPIRYVRPSKDGAEVLRIPDSGVDNSAMQVRFSKGAGQIAFHKFGISNVKPIIPGIEQLRDFTVIALKLLAREF